MMRLTLAQANALIAAAQAEAVTMGLKPLTIAVQDPTGSLIALERQDGAPKIGPKIAAGKAAGALAFGVSSRRIAEMAAGIIPPSSPMPPHSMMAG